MAELPIGCIFCYPSPICPEGFLPCDGRELSKKSYPELYALIRGTWGETVSTFFLPDLRGLFVRGYDDEGDIDPEREFGTIQDDALQGHSHEIKLSSESTSSNGSHSHEILADGRKTFSGESKERGVISTYYHDLQGGKTTTNGSHSHSLPKINIEDPKNSTFGIVKIGSETRPKNMSLMYCIKVKP